MLESTFTSIADLAREQFLGLPIGPLLSHPFLTRELPGRIHIPVLVAHGSDDSLISVEHGRALATMFSADPYLEVPGIDHNEVLFEGDVQDQYIAFLERVVPTEGP